MQIILGIKKLAHSFLEYFRDDKIYEHVAPSSIVSPNAKIYDSNNLYMGENGSIGPDSIIMNTRAKVLIGRHFVSGPRLAIITGDHMPIVGRYLNTISGIEKNKLDTNHEFDKDVTIEDDVWTGYNVTIMKGVTIGRGTVIAACAVVTNSLPPYCVGGGYSCKSHKIPMDNRANS